MKIIDKKFQNLSAYIDEELNQTDKLLFEEQLKTDSSLLQEYIKQKNIKNSISELKPLPEDNYFETRLFERLKTEKQSNKFSFLFRKPIVIFASFTIVLMLVFKFSPGFFPGLFEEQKSNLIDLYADNLKPFMLTSGLNADDIFNFAFNKRITLNKAQNQILVMGIDDNGNDYFEVKVEKNSIPPQNNVSLASFVSALQLNKKQKKQVDSILISYSNDLASQILVNENKTVAVNPHIVNYQNALRADLMAFASQANSKIFERIFPSEKKIGNQTELAEMVLQIKQKKNADNYVFITPDTIFSQSLDVDKALIHFEVERAKNQAVVGFGNVPSSNHSQNFVKNKKSPNIVTDRGFKVFVDEDYCKVEIPNFAIPVIPFPNFDVINEQIESAFGHMRDMQISIRIDSAGRKSSLSVKAKIGKQNSTREYIDKLNASNESGQSLDSLQSFFKYFFQDTVMFKSKELQREMERVKKEMEYFRKEMERMRKEFQPQVSPKPDKKPIEI